MENRAGMVHTGYNSKLFAFEKSFFLHGYTSKGSLCIFSVNAHIHRSIINNTQEGDNVSHKIVNSEPESGLSVYALSYRKHDHS